MFPNVTDTFKHMFHRNVKKKVHLLYMRLKKVTLAYSYISAEFGSIHYYSSLGEYSDACLYTYLTIM